MSNDCRHMLFTIGNEQADMTGQRLHDLGHSYKILIHSSMKRAIETANGIHKHLPDVSMVQCDLLREGAPWPPVPPSKNWRPEYKVRVKKLQVVSVAPVKHLCGHVLLD
jgi:serine/threonine-protein phosphatase PGAM5